MSEIEIDDTWYPLMNEKAFGLLDGYVVNCLYIIPEERGKGLYRKAMKEFQKEFYHDTIYVASVVEFLVPAMKSLGWKEMNEDEISPDGYVNFWRDEGDAGIGIQDGYYFNNERGREELLIPMKYKREVDEK